MGWGKNFLVKTKDATNNHKAFNEEGSDYQSYDNYYYDYQQDKFDTERDCKQEENQKDKKCCGRNYFWRCCTPQNPCGEGEGDCDGPLDGGENDGDDGCEGDLVCGRNNCK